VTSLSGCIGLLPPRRGQMLSLRAGLGGAAPLSRSAAAAQVGIAAGRAARVERRALRQLRRAGRSGGCGVSTPAGSLVGGSVPRLQPAVLLEPQPALRPTADLGGRVDGGKEGQGVKSATASSDSPPDGARSTAGLPFRPIAQAVDGGGPDMWLVMLAALATAAATMLLLRRRAEGRPAPAAAAAPIAPVATAWPEVEAEPVPWAPAGAAQGTALELRADALIPDLAGTNAPPVVVDEPEVGETLPYFRFAEAAGEAVNGGSAEASDRELSSNPAAEPGAVEGNEGIGSNGTPPSEWAPPEGARAEAAAPVVPATHRGRRAMVAAGGVASLLVTALIRRRRR
jgi:hypothetical protein